MQTTNLKITGMMCDACVSHVSKAIKRLPGVTAVDVNLEQATAVVRHEAVAPAALLAAVDEAGYQAAVAD